MATSYCVPKNPNGDGAGALTRGKAAASAILKRLRAQQNAAAPGVPASVVNALAQQTSPAGVLLEPPYADFRLAVLPDYFESTTNAQVRAEFTAQLGNPLEFVDERGIILNADQTETQESFNPRSTGVWVKYVVGGVTLYATGVRDSAGKITLATSGRIVVRRDTPPLANSQDAINEFTLFDLTQFAPLFSAPQQVTYDYTHTDNTLGSMILTPVRYAGSFLPFGRDFGAIRPPGTPQNTKFSYKVSWREASIFLGQLGFVMPPEVEKLDLELGVAGRRGSNVTLRAYDNRPSTAGGHGLVDPGPFGAARGLLAGVPFIPDGEVLRPAGKPFDDRRGGTVVVYPEEDVRGLIDQLTDATKKDILKRLYVLDDHTYIDGFLKLGLAVVYGQEVWEHRETREDVGDDFYILSELTILVLRVTLLDTACGLALKSAILANNPVAALSDLTQAKLVTKTPNVWTARDVLPDTPLPEWQQDRFYTEDERNQIIPLLVYTDTVDTTKLIINTREYIPPVGVNFEYLPNALTQARNPRNMQAVCVVLHWGSVDTLGALNSAGTGTHFIVETTGAIKQVFDVGDTAYHTGGINAALIGIDMQTTHINVSPASAAFNAENGLESIPIKFLEPSYRTLHIPPVEAYESVHKLVNTLRTLSAPNELSTQALQHTQGVVAHPDAAGNTQEIVYVESGIIHRPNSPYVIRGYLPHASLSRPGQNKYDGVDLFIYCVLRDLGISSADAFESMKSTLQGDLINATHGRALVLVRT